MVSIKYKKLARVADDQFRRLTGVKRKTFDKMSSILLAANKIKKAKGGRNNSPCIKDMLLMSLEYVREYRTYFHYSLLVEVMESVRIQLTRQLDGLKTP